MFIGGKIFLLVKKLALQWQTDGSFSGMIISTTGKCNEPLNVINFVTTNVAANNASLHCWEDWEMSFH